MSKSTKDIIIEAARDLFSENSYHKTSMSMIAERAGISKGTLYWHFASKEELFQQIMSSGGSYIFKKTKEIVNSDLPADKKIYEYLKLKTIFFSQHQKLAAIILNNTELISEEFKEKMIKGHLRRVDLMVEIVDQGIKEKIFAEQDPAILAVLIIQISNTLHSEMICIDEIDEEEKIDVLFEFIMHGVKRGKKNEG